MIQTTVQLDDSTRQKMGALAEWWGMPPQRHMTPIIQHAIQQAHAIEAARRSLSDSDFVGFMAELYRPIGGGNGQ